MTKIRARTFFHRLLLDSACEWEYTLRSLIPENQHESSRNAASTTCSENSQHPCALSTPGRECAAELY